MDKVAAQEFSVFAASFEGSSSTMSFCLHKLTLKPDIQLRVQEDIDSVLQKHGGELTYETIQDMEYLDKTVTKALCKQPPLTVLTCECNKDYTIPGTQMIVEKGIHTVIPVEAIHYDPQYFPEPDRFDPERFSEEAEEKETPLRIPAIRRRAQDMRFGLMESKVGLISVLSNYDVSVCERTSIPLKKDPKQFVNTPLAGIWLRIRDRVNKRR